MHLNSFEFQTEFVICMCSQIIFRTFQFSFGATFSFFFFFIVSFVFLLEPNHFGLVLSLLVIQNKNTIYHILVACALWNWKKKSIFVSSSFVLMSFVRKHFGFSVYLIVLIATFLLNRIECFVYFKIKIARYLLFHAAINLSFSIALNFLFIFVFHFYVCCH